MEEIFSLPPLGAFDNNYQMVLEFMDTLGNPKFKIAGDVDLENSDIESLGNLVEVEGYLILYKVNIESLPDNLKVGGFLGLSYTNIKSLGDNLHVGGDLYLRYTPLSAMYTRKEIRKMIKDKGGFVKGDIYI